uniref:Uncharacterized protein n=1 Tax=Ditylenchus dipsaci TaxID=166011 RepID=A0A915D0K0_9BILA
MNWGCQRLQKSDQKFLEEYATEYSCEAMNPGDWIAFWPKKISRQTKTFGCRAFICQMQSAYVVVLSLISPKTR